MSKLTTSGIVRLSYPRLWEPVEQNNSTVKKYQANFIIPKKDKATISQINNAIEEAIQEGIKSKWGGKKPAKLTLPLRDGDVDKEDDPAYANSYFINAKANADRPPLVLDRFKNAIIDKSEVYSGCYGLAAITLYPYDSNGSKGVAVGLNGFVKMKDGQPLGSTVTIDSIFEGIDIDSYDLEEDDEL